VELEAENVFARVGGSSSCREWRVFRADLGTKLLPQPESWDAAVAKARALFGRFSHRAHVGTLDVVVLASAMKAEATHFLSFDANSSVRALAAVLKLNFYPELTVEDKRRMVNFC
jgi:hypothetical protein